MKMKQYTKLIFSIALVAMLGGCDYLEYDEKSYLLEENIFEEFSRTKKFLTNIYSQLPHDFSTVNGAMRSSGTDEAIHVITYLISSGLQTVLGVPYKQ